MFYAPGLLGYSAVKIASPTFYSLRDSRTPVIVSVIDGVVNLVLNLMLVRVLGFRGLALGTALAAIFNAVALLWLLRGRLDGLDGRRVAIALAQDPRGLDGDGRRRVVVGPALQSVLPGAAASWKHVDVYLALGSMAGHRRRRGCAGCLRAPARIAEFDEAAARLLRRLVRREGDACDRPS